MRNGLLAKSPKLQRHEARWPREMLLATPAPSSLVTGSLHWQEDGGLGESGRAPVFGTRDPTATGTPRQGRTPWRACRRPSKPGLRGIGRCGSEPRPGPWPRLSRTHRQHSPGGQQRSLAGPRPQAPTSPPCLQKLEPQSQPAEAGTPEAMKHS